MTATRHLSWRSEAMRTDAKYFRERAKMMRDLAETAGDDAAHRLLLQIATEFEEEARHLDDEGDPSR